jgi:phosphoserine phosphatase
MGTYYLLDLDRCLINTNALHMVFDEIVRGTGILDVNDIIAAKKLVEDSSGGSFDTAEFVRTELKKRGQLDKWNDIEKEFIVASQDYDYLMPGARELIDLLTSRRQNFGVITYGGAVWQQVKMQAAGIDSIPHIITSQKNKGLLISEWVEDGCVPNELECVPFDNVVLVDDKVVSFNGFPSSRAIGYQVRTGVDIVVDETLLPENVVSVESLYDVISIFEHNIIDK